MKNKSLINAENRAIESSVSQDKVNNSNLYLDETDSKGVPLLRRVEKYPDLPENEFIPIEYPNLDLSPYLVNKKGEIYNPEINKIYVGYSTLKGYLDFRFSLGNNKTFSTKVHRIVAFTFLKNSDYNLYDVVNHIDHNRSNNQLSNLEWVTRAKNNEKDKFSKKQPIEKYITYTALNDKKEELFNISYLNPKKEYIFTGVQRAIRLNIKYKGYYWKKSFDKKKKVISGFSGNLDDYEWFEHWKYPGKLYVCKEGFIKIDNKIIYKITNEGYIHIKIRRKDLKINSFAHRIIMEYILKRNLGEKEVVDHINTVRTDNSFSNLKLSNKKENMNNPITREKLSKKSILTDLYGDFISYDYIKNLRKIIYYNNFDRLIRDTLKSFPVRSSGIKNKEFLCIELGDKELLYKKMESVVYKFSKDKSEILGAYDSSRTASKTTSISYKLISKYLNSEKSAPDGYYYMRGPEAVKLVLSLGHGTAGDFKPE